MTSASKPEVEASMRAMQPDLIKAHRWAYEQQGAAAFQVTERATCLHEAGHAVIGMALAGIAPRRIWIGARVRRTPLAGAVIRVGETTYKKGSLFRRTLDVRRDAPEDIIVRSAHALAGAGAEMIFDRDDYRMGSSLDETIEAEGALIGLGIVRLGMTETAAPALIYLVRNVVMATLKANETTSLRVADALKDRRELRERALSKLLANVKRPKSPAGEWVLANAQSVVEAAGGDVRKWMERGAAGGSAAS